MADIRDTTSPVSAALLAADKLTDSRSQSKLFGEIARLQTANEEFDDAFQTLRKITVPDECRTVLLLINWQPLPLERIAALVNLLESRPQTAFLAGRLAMNMLEENGSMQPSPPLKETSARQKKNNAAAWKLINTAKQPFESEEQRYHFFHRMISIIQQYQCLPGWQEEQQKAVSFSASFTDEIYRDWAFYDLAAHCLSEAENFADKIAHPLRRAWCYNALRNYEKAKEIIETINIVAEKQDEAEMLSIASRIIGMNIGKEAGASLLERSEAAAAVIKIPMTRYRLQCFLGKVLKEQGRITAIEEYLPVRDMLASLSHFDRSRAAVWLAEAGWTAGWAAAVESAAAPMRGIPETDRAEQMTEVIRRYAAYRARLKRAANGYAIDETILFSGEELERSSFSPFALSDCGC
ncbi:MAG: hypothetical protein LBH00_05085 [Planctomycetaceae bacterium]|jgi:tetratricopeptide (TPR) repeat protein|nr:hypothetical protein [Planctomycetaceae bacterium]